VLSGIATVGAQMSRDLARLLDIKDNAQYGVLFVSAKVAAQSVRWAQRMVAVAETVVAG
jgi:hypothetical protein